MTTDELNRAVAKERPILFSGAMVRAILAGRKTQTRRVVMPQPADCGFGKDCSVKPYCTGTKWPLAYYERRGGTWNSSPPLRAKYGQAGDRLRVKEAAWMWCEKRPNGTTKKGRPKFHYVPLRAAPVHYCADHPAKPQVEVVSPETGNAWGWRMKVARFLPRWASRTTLEIVSVRVERLQEISEDDARAEGVLPPINDDGSVECGRRKGEFVKLWDSINAEREDGKFAWEANPYVWVIEFKKLDGAQ